MGASTTEKSINEISLLPVLIWAVSCFDRRKENPLPAYNRWYWLDWSTLSDRQISEIRQIAEEKQRSNTHLSMEPDESIVTTSNSTSDFNSRMLKYRKLFTAIPDNNLESFIKVPGSNDRRVQTFSVPDYFEDENGVPITKYQMIWHVSGQEFPIIVGDAESVTRLGPSDPINNNEWTVDRANTIAQYLEVVERIFLSKWYRSPQQIMESINDSGNRTTLEAIFPNDEKLMSVLPYFRQLHAKDKLLIKACNVYLAHTCDERKRWWVNERKQAFITLVDSQPSLYREVNKSRREIVSMFMYGAGLLHSSSNNGGNAELDRLIAQYGKYEAVMILNFCLMDFYRIAATLHPVIRQDFDYWLSSSGLTRPNRVAISDLFTGLSKPPNNI